MGPRHQRRCSTRNRLRKSFTGGPLPVARTEREVLVEIESRGSPLPCGSVQWKLQPCLTKSPDKDTMGQVAMLTEGMPRGGGGARDPLTRPLQATDSSSDPNISTLFEGDPGLARFTVAFARQEAESGGCQWSFAAAFRQPGPEELGGYAAGHPHQAAFRGDLPYGPSQPKKLRSADT